MKHPLFWDKQSNRPRLILRLVGQLLFLAAALIVLDGLTNPVRSRIPVLADAVVGITAFSLSLWLAARWLDKKPFVSYGFQLSPRWWGQFLFGLLLGGGLFTVVFGLEWTLGFVNITATNVVLLPDQSLLTALWLAGVSFFIVAYTEELLFRGYQLHNLLEAAEKQTGRRKTAVSLGAVLLSSIIFALPHGGNPAATPTSTFLLIGLGILFAYAYMATGQLALPISLHWSWNFFQGNVFGFPVSGWPVEFGTLLQIKQSGPVWFTGGDFGPEAGLIGLIALLLGGGCIWLFTNITNTQRI